MPPAPLNVRHQPPGGNARRRRVEQIRRQREYVTRLRIAPNYCVLVNVGLIERILDPPEQLSKSPSIFPLPQHLRGPRAQQRTPCEIRGVNHIIRRLRLDAQPVAETVILLRRQALSGGTLLAE